MGGCVLQKRRLGHTDIEVSVIGLGTVKFGRKQGVKYPLPFELPSDNQIENLLAVSRHLGINLLDTAPAYGLSEERLGKCLQGQRHDWVISTKVGETFADGLSTFDFSKAAITESIECSLERLQTDYLDIVLVHSSGDDERIILEDRVFETLSTLKTAGKIRAIGCSTKTVAGGFLSVDHADVVMVTYHPECTDDKTVIQYAHQKQKGVLIKKALASGHINRPVADSLRFVLKEPGVTSVIVGTINEMHLREVCGDFTKI